MAEILLDAQSAPSTPSAGQVFIYPDTTNKMIVSKDEGGRCYGFSFNAATAAQGAGFATDTYLTNSDIQIPNFGLQQKATLLWRVSASKSGAGTAQPIYNIRVGTNRTTADTARLTLTGPAQTAIADIGTLYIMATLRAGGAATVIQGTAYWVHRGTAANTTTSGTGFANDTSGHIEGTGAAFDASALAGNYIGLSINGGTSASWTLTQCIVEANW